MRCSSDNRSQTSRLRGFDWMRIRYFMGLHSFAHPACRSRAADFDVSAEVPVFLSEDPMQEIQDVIESRYTHLAAGDVKGMRASYAPEVVQYPLAPPLAGPLDGHDPAPTEQWLTGFEAPPVRAVT